MKNIPALFIYCFIFIFGPLSLDVFAEIDSDPYILYASTLTDAPRGTYAKDGYVFFITDIEISGKRVKRIVYEGRAMLDTLTLVKEFFSQFISVDSSKFSEYSAPIGRRIQRQAASKDLFDFSLEDISGKILVNNEIIKQERRYYRYVFAVSESEILAKKKFYSSIKMDAEFILKKIIKDTKLINDQQELAQLYMELGLWEEALICNKKILSSKVNIVNYYHAKDPIAERKKLREILASNGEIKDPQSLLRILPGNPEALDSFANNSVLEPLEQVVVHFIKLAAVPDELQSKELELLTAQLQKLSDSFPINEYVATVEGFLSNRHKFPHWRNALAKSVLDTMGHLELSEELDSSENEYFRSAKRIFNARGNKKEIVELLLRSLDQSPRHSESWNYLGAIMTAEERKYEALAFHLQSYQIDSDNVETMAQIADCYLRLGQKELARKYAASIGIIYGNANTPFVKKVINIIKSEVTK